MQVAVFLELLTLQQFMIGVNDVSRVLKEWMNPTSQLKKSSFRGVSYEVASTKRGKKQMQNTSGNSYEVNTGIIGKVPKGNYSHGDGHLTQGKLVPSIDENKVEPVPQVNYEHEIDKLLDGLGARYTDWPRGDPLPIDADFLPGVVLGYQPPFIILPYGVKSTIGLKEMTALRRLARTLPPQFVVGRSSNIRGWPWPWLSCGKEVKLQRYHLRVACSLPPVREWLKISK